MNKAELRYGIFMPPFHALDEDPTLCLERDFDLICNLDKLGYDEAWIGEHHSGGFEIIAAPELFIAAAAERTTRIRLGTGVMSLPYHHPFMVAGRIAQLDHQTRGRAMFGFGPGLLNSDAQMLGIEAHTQRDRMGEAINVITRLLDGEIVTKETEWFTLREGRMQLGPYKGRRPHLAATSTITPNDAVLAGQYGLGVLSVAAASKDGFSKLDYNWGVTQETAAKHGNVVDAGNWRLMAPMHIAETRQQALKDLEYGFEKWSDYAFKMSPVGPASIGLGPPEQMIETQSAVIGTVDDAVEQLERYWAKTGGFGCLLILAQEWASPEATMKSFELIARQVAPRFAARNERRERSYHWMGEHVDAFTLARESAVELAIKKHEQAKGAAS
ncbi:MAG: LLM class flavin-dependent oxidoreductase [Croceibacterium sp.]